MKREYVLPDLLAAMTADALFAGGPDENAAKPAGRKPAFLLHRWVSATSGGKSGAASETSAKADGGDPAPGFDGVAAKERR